MTEYYFDIETNTEGREKPDPLLDKILCIQYCPIYSNSGRRKTKNLTILKSWKMSEKEILEKFLEIAHWDEEKMWNFIPIGFNLAYDLIVIKNRCKELLNIDLSYDFLFRDLPKMDLKTAIIMANRGSFKGASLDAFSNKKTDGKSLALYINKAQWKDIVNYIEQEAESFLEIFGKLARGIPRILPKMHNNM